MSPPRKPAARASPESLELVRRSAPVDLLALPRWVGWNGTRGSNGKLSKTPLNPRTGGNAQSNAPGTWSSFEHACALALRDKRVGGVGLVLTSSDYWALDLDHVIDSSTGELRPAVQRFLGSLTP